MKAYHYYEDSAKVLLNLNYGDSFDNTTLIKIAAAIKNISSQLKSTEKQLNHIKEVLYKVYPFREYKMKYSDRFQKFFQVLRQFQEWEEKIDSPNFFDLLTVNYVKSIHVIFENNYRSGINSGNPNFEKKIQDIKNACMIIDEFYNKKAMLTKLYVVGNARSSKKEFFSLNEGYHYKEFSIVKFNKEEETFQTRFYNLEQFDGNQYYPSSNDQSPSLEAVLKTRERFPAEVEYLQKYYSEYLI